MKHDNFERKSPINTPYLNRAKTILLKQAICQAENDMLALIGKGVSLANIEAAVGGLRDAKHTLKIALQDGFLHHRKLCEVMNVLVRLASGIRLESLLEAINRAMSLDAATPDKAPQLRGVPYYFLTEKTEALFGTPIPNHNQPKNADEAATSVGGAK